jgi:hypothetical protein
MHPQYKIIFKRQFLKKKKKKEKHGGRGEALTETARTTLDV